MYTIHHWLLALLVWSLLIFPGFVAAQPSSEALIHPILEKVDPDPVLPGDEVFVSGTGGFIEFEDSSTDKSLRTFTLAFDGIPLGTLECVNDLCGGTLIVPQDTTPGVHAISEPGGGSMLEVTVDTPPPVEPPPPPPPPVNPQGAGTKSPSLFSELPFAGPHLLGSASLRETDVVHFSGAAPDALPYIFVTAVGTGSQIKLTSWQVGAQFTPVLNSVALPGFDVRLHKPNILGRILVSAARRNDGNLWLTSWRVTAPGLLVKLQSRGYGDNAGIIVKGHGIAGRALSQNVAQIATAIVDQNHEVHLVTWQVDNNGNIIGKSDSGPIETLPPSSDIESADGAAPSIALQRGTEYVVNFRDSGGNLAWQHWAVSNTGVPLLLGETAQQLNIRGASPLAPWAGLGFAALPLTRSGQTVARLNTGVGANGLPLQLITYEHNRIPSILLQYTNPYFISSDLNDTTAGEGVTLIPALQPVINTNSGQIRYMLTDGLFESALGKGGGTLLSVSPPSPPAAGIGSVVKAMNLHLVLEVVNADLIPPDEGKSSALDNCVELTAEVFGGAGQSYTNFEAARTFKVGGQLLTEGDQVSLRTLLYTSIMTSDRPATAAAAFYAAKALFGADKTFAELVGGTGSQGLWIQEMTNRALELGMEDTLYCGTAGSGHSTPQDQVTFWMHAALDPKFIDITSKLSFTPADINAEQDQCGLQLLTFNKPTSNATNYPGFRGAKGGNASSSLAAGYVGNDLQCNLTLSPAVDALGACQACLDNHAMRLERPLFVTQSQVIGNITRRNNAMNLLDYGFQLQFTPDRLADNGAQGGTVGDFALASLDPVLNVSAGIVDNKKLEVCLWKVSQSGVQKQQCLQRTYVGLQAGPANVPQTLVDMVDVTSIGADADYLTGFKLNGKLRLDLWRIGPRPTGFIP